MKNKKSVLLLFLLTFIKVGQSFAQESILSEVSYLYMDKLIAEAKANYPRIKRLNSEINVAKADLSSAKVSWLEPLSFQYVVRSNAPNTNAVVDVQTADLLTGYQFGISISPGALFAKPSQIKKAKEQVKIAESEQSEYLLQLENLVKSRYIMFLRFQKALVPINNAYANAQSDFEAIKLKYQKAEVTFLEYNSASTSLNSAFQAKIQAESDYLNAKFSLEELTVTKLELIK